MQASERTPAASLLCPVVRAQDGGRVVRVGSGRQAAFLVSALVRVSWLDKIQIRNK